jgi:hypothetical protein
MKYRFIKYARTRNLPNHENERIEVSVEVHNGEDPEKVFEDARDFVEVRLGLRKETKKRGGELLPPGKAADQPTKEYVDRQHGSGATFADALAAKGQTL